MRVAARLFLALLAVGLLGATAPQPKLVPDVSQREVEIRYSFTGAQLLLFGAILYPGGKVPADPADIIVVLRGPSQQLVMREKRQVAGIWLNANSAEFRSAPSFYAVASSRPIRDMVDERTAAIYELGLDKLQLSPSSLNDGVEIDRFSRGLTDLRIRNGLFVERPGSVRITDGVLYQATLPLSARVVVGTYTAETFLVRDGRVLAAAVREIEVRKSGFERLMGVFADRQPVLYGLTAVAMALSLGLLAGYLAQRI
ncbi:TIGR02186 family protein [Sphingobium sufflavum]|nr:TIGR02186 family protein [Sphingobium sufflavum]MCE7795125.1 TIGR02186 family protein [Sphingobium sufflavum]